MHWPTIDHVPLLSAVPRLDAIRHGRSGLHSPAQSHTGVAEPDPHIMIATRLTAGIRQRPRNRITPNPLTDLPAAIATRTIGSDVATVESGFDNAAITRGNSNDLW